MCRLIVLVAVVLAGAVATSASAGTGHAATAKKTYWTESRAEAMVVAKARIPLCRVFPDDSGCPDGRSRTMRLGIASANCTGHGELGSTFRFSRFTCHFVLRYGYGEGNLAVYVTGPLTFRYMLI